MSRRSLENYVPVNVRIARFKSDHNGKGTIETESFINFEKECAHFKASIKVDGNVISNGHSLVTDLADSKSFEKGETAAIGRALAHAGYEAEDPTFSKEVKKDSKPKSKGLGAAKSMPKKVSKLSNVTKPVKESLDKVEKTESSEEKVTESLEESKEVSSKKSNLDDVMAKYGLRK